MRTMTVTTWLMAVGLVASATAEATAQGHGHGHAGPAAHSRSRVDTPATHEFEAAHARMMRDMAAPFTGDPDIDFRTHMIPHHQGAIDMARVALRHAKDPSTRQIADAIIIAQEREILEFKGWLARRGAMAYSGSADSSATREFKAAHARMMRSMAMPFTGDPDVDFRMHMIPHHQGAIDMARVALRHAKDGVTRLNAENIILAQQQEIAQFQTELASAGAMVPGGKQPLYTTNSNSYPRNTEDDPGSRNELVGQTWAPGSGVPAQPDVHRR